MDDTFTPYSLIPAPVKAFVGDITGLSTKETEYTEDFFGDSDLQMMKTLIAEKLKENPKAKSGAIQYKDYPTGESGVYYKGGFDKVVDIFKSPEQRIKKTLGQFTWKRDNEGNIIINDQFNFNDASRVQQDKGTLEKLKGLSADILHEDHDIFSYGSLRKAASYFGSPEGEGARFKINLGKL